MFFTLWLTAMHMQADPVLTRPCVDVRLDWPKDYYDYKEQLGDFDRDYKDMHINTTNELHRVTKALRKCRLAAQEVCDE